MIYITGDTHGNIDLKKLKEYFKKRYVTKKDYLIILGDCGIFFDDNDDIFPYQTLGLTIFFIDGNHENFSNLNRFPIIEMNNAKLHMISENIFHIIRGEVLVLNKLKFLCIGGADSIDKQYRTINKNYWLEENITDEDINNALENAKKNNYKVDYILTHCADSATVKRVFRYGADQSTEQLLKIRDKVEYNYWYFGHYHEDIMIDSKRRCFYQNILEINSLYLGSKRAVSPYYRMYKDYLYSNKWGRTTLTVSDLPEWYYEGPYEYYYSLKGIKDVAFRPSPFENHIDKDSRIYLSYNDKLNKDENLKLLDDKYDIDTYRVYLKDFVLGIEKYSPDIDTKGLKIQINYVCDNYNNDKYTIFPSYTTRYFKEIDTPIREGTIAVVIDGDYTVGAFNTIDRAKDFIKKYIEKFKIKEVLEGKEDADFYIKYIKENMEEIILKKVS